MTTAQEVISAIKKEIERRLKKYATDVTMPLEVLGKVIFELKGILSFLNTLSEEPDKSLNTVADYARRQAEELLSVIKEYNDYSEEQIEELRTHLMAMFLEGTAWQKSQMLKGAYVESQIVEDGRIELEGEPLPCLNPIILLPYPQFEPGYKVRLIVLKAEEE